MDDIEAFRIPGFGAFPEILLVLEVGQGTLQVLVLYILGTACYEAMNGSAKEIVPDSYKATAARIINILAVQGSNAEVSSVVLHLTSFTKVIA